LQAIQSFPFLIFFPLLFAGIPTHLYFTMLLFHSP
jgi:hypothetical protein